MSFQEKQLGQYRPEAAATDYSVVWASDESVTVIIKSMAVACMSVDTGFFIFQDNDGTDCTATTALSFDTELSAGSTTWISGFYPMDNTAGGLWFQINDASAATLTVWGAEIQP